MTAYQTSRKLEDFYMLVVGHGGHGKGTLCSSIKSKLGFDSISSSLAITKQDWFLAHLNDRILSYSLEGMFKPYGSIEEAYKDRSSHRAIWGDIIADYNYPNAEQLALDIKEMESIKVYDGMRRLREYQTCNQLDLFDVVLWVDRSEHVELEDPSSMELAYDPSMSWIDNNKDPAYAYELAVQSLGFYFTKYPYDLDVEAKRISLGSEPLLNPAQ